MTMVWRRIKRSGYHASKFNVTVNLRELVIDYAGHEHGFERLVVALMHRKRRYTCEPQVPERSASKDQRVLVVWASNDLVPGVAKDGIICLDTTLFREPSSEQFDDKEWTLVVEGMTPKNKHRPLAALPLNMRFFVSEDPTLKTELKLKLQPLNKCIESCTLSLLLESTLLRKGKATDDDMVSLTSSASDRRTSATAAPAVVPDVLDSAVVASEAANIHREVERWRAEVEEECPAEIVKPVPAPPARHAWGEPEEPTPSAVPQHPQQPPPPLPPVHHPLPQKDPTTILRELPPPPPTPIKDESILAWCKRVTKQYRQVRINDLSKSFRTGIAFCAIIHRYDPSLIGPIDDLDHSHSKTGCVANCNKAFAAARSLGVQPTLDAGELTTMPDERAITAYLLSLRAALQGDSEVTPVVDVRTSEYRFSTIIGLSEAEQNVMRDMERLRQPQPPVEPERVNHNHVPPAPVARTASVESSSSLSIRDEVDSCPPVSRSRRDSLKLLEQQEKALNQSVRDLEKLMAAENGSNGDIPSAVGLDPTRRQSRRSMPVPVASPDMTDDEKARKREEEARRLIAGVFGGEERPHSAGGVEDADYSINDRDQAAQAYPDTVTVTRTTRTVLDNVNATPTRKIVTEFEKSVQVEDAAKEIQKTTERLEELEKLDKHILENLQKFEANSADYEKNFSKHIELTNERDRLVRYQDYLNINIDLHDVEKELIRVQAAVAQVAATNDPALTEEEKQEQINALMKEYQANIDKKNDLALQLAEKEIEEEESAELGRRTLQRSKNFQRGSQEPLNTSQRLMQWFKSSTATN